ncbi:MAG: sugar-binding transcriptional regulator [Caldicoprobacterales bacterium]|jgi:deoxyribonucleoside regulator
MDKKKLLVNISRLYYEHNYSQQMIAEKLNLSRPYVSKLISEAKDKGIVKIIINDPDEMETSIELSVREKFGLLKVIAIPTIDAETDIISRIGKAAGRYLDNIIKDNDIIGTAWGTTLYNFSTNVVPRGDLKNITVVQLCGGISNIEKNIFASEIPKNLADMYKGTPYILPLPAVVDNSRVKEIILREKNISKVLDIANKANIAIFTMGPFGYDGALSRAGYISHDDVDRLIKKGAVGDICTRIIDIDGNVCDENLNNRTIGIELDELKKKEYRIGVAVGENRLNCIYAALKKQYANVLITDEEIALKLLKLP